MQQEIVIGFREIAIGLFLFIAFLGLMALPSPRPNLDPWERPPAPLSIWKRIAKEFREVFMN